MPRDGEPPSLSASVDRVIALAHVMPQPHVVVIGRHTLPLILALLSSGCGGVRSLRPDAAAPDCEAADLAWILDAESEHEFDNALRAAHRRTGCVIVEDTACRHCPATLRRHANDAGLDIVSVDAAGRRIILGPLTPQGLVAVTAG